MNTRMVNILTVQRVIFMGTNIRDQLCKASRINFHGFKFYDCGTGRVAES